MITRRKGTAAKQANSVKRTTRKEIRANLQEVRKRIHSKKGDKEYEAYCFFIAYKNRKWKRRKFGERSPVLPVKGKVRERRFVSNVTG